MLMTTIKVRKPGSIGTGEHRFVEHRYAPDGSVVCAGYLVEGEQGERERELVATASCSTVVQM